MTNEAPQILPRDDGAADLVDLARNVAGMDDRVLLSADVHMLRATLREFRDQARAALDKRI